MRRCAPAAAWLLPLALASVFALSDATGEQEVVRRKGKPLRGTISRQGDVVRVNPYGSTVADMTFGVVEIPAADVEEIREVPTHAGLAQGLLALERRDLAERRDLLTLALRLRAKPEVRRLAGSVLLLDPTDEDALARVGGRDAWIQRRRGDPRLDADLRRDEANMIRRETAAERRADADRLARERGYPVSPVRIERMARSAWEPRGVLHDRLLTPDDRAPTASRSSLFVPTAYDPTTPHPLVIALHGGEAPDGRVTGAPRDAFDLFARSAEKRGWLLVCPGLAQGEGGWATPGGRRRVEAVLAAIRARYHVDDARLYVVGQGTGADGALAIGRALSREVAAVGSAGASRPDVARTLASRRIGVWLHHGDADDVVPVSVARQAASALRRARPDDVVYCELPGQGHGVPAAAEEDLYRFLEGRRRPGERSAWPASSLDRPVGVEERRAVGDPAAAWGLGEDAPTDATTLLAVLGRGGSTAEPAARRLLEAADIDLEAVVDLLRDASRPDASRRWAAWLLGRRGGASAVPALGEAARGARDLRLRIEAVRALERLGAATATVQGDLLQALEDLRGAWRRRDPAMWPLPGVRTEATFRWATSLADALGRCGNEDVPARIEAALVVGILKDGRRVAARPELGEDVAALRAMLARAVGRAYGRLGAEPTLMDLLRSVVGRDKDEGRALAGAEAGWREGRGLR